MKQLLLSSLLLLSLAAQGQPKPANQITKQDMQLALDREMHAVDSAMVDTCSHQFPDLAKRIKVNWEDQLKALAPEIARYRETPQFKKTVLGYKQEQSAEAKKPENRQMLQALCHAMAE